MHIRHSIFATCALFSFLSGSAANADTLISNAAGTDTSNFKNSDYFGQSFTTGANEAGYELDSIFLTGSGGAFHVGSGTLYLYSQAFTSTASNLGLGTGFLGSSTYTPTGDAGWNFTGITLDPNAMYYFYVHPDSTFDVARTTGNQYSGGNYYYAYASSATFSDPTSGSVDLAFSVNGGAIPEPATAAGIAGVAAIALAAMKRRKK